ncbi:Crp/Fnr family transcriptional regulator [Bacillus sonorensis]|uniref:Regulator n=2 Tax=Bacillus sonorensis TaxID=119858 RepID=M5P6P9_9BACI|nr:MULTISPECIES: Crp/Fnr family transcriptional regulator [Bacillus]EME75696.1 regulator [Bacillus sonorensis L12]MCZ0075141.1 Crp/Fnr family transcriptional regulator [Bacillus sonorensis]MCZ0093281.1 Crp/Fnr family transcriptional regulator [Bacillus sonorensis]MEC1427559.1 Crp/Fnr family transcriptional regulator [Bacillus sonorensis]WOV58772.1 Crp/Fnr family transcriptional regulator [Bacillus sp. KICET-3]
MMEFLKQFLIFSGLNEEEFKQIERIAMKRTYQPRMFVFMEGEEREAVFFIKSGLVKTYKIDEAGNEQVISLLQSGDMFPHVGFFDRSPYPATAEAVQETELIVIRIADFDDLLMKYPQMTIKVMEIMGKKIIDLQERIQGFISKDVQHRLTHALMKLAAEHGVRKGKGVYINLPITNQDFANMVGTSRETINRTLNEMKKKNLLSADRSGILIYDAEWLNGSS